jgi:ribosomal protein S18 acetylase RimI-like enzyme
MTIRVRAGSVADAAVVAEFNRRLALETENLTLDNHILARGVEAVLGDPSRGLYFVAEIQDQVVGQLMVTFEWSDWRNGWIWWLQSVYVHAEHRRRGVFRTLWQAALAEGRSRGVVLFRLYVERANDKAQAVYQCLGFTEMHFRLYQRIV